MTAHSWSLSLRELAGRLPWITPSLEGLSDEELAEGAATGSSDHFAALVRRYSAGVYRIGYLTFGSRGQAEDMAQETFIRLFRALPRYRLDLPFKPWLYRIAVNAARSIRRWNGSRPEEGPELTGREISPEDTAESAAARLDTYEALSALSEDYRQVVILRVVEGMTFAEISQVLGVLEATARTKFHRAKGLLRNFLAPDRSFRETPGSGV